MIKRFNILEEVFDNDEQMEDLHEQLTATATFVEDLAKLVDVPDQKNPHQIKLVITTMIHLVELSNTITMVQASLAEGKSDYNKIAVQTLIDHIDDKVDSVNEIFKDNAHLYPPNAGTMVPVTLIHPIEVEGIEDLDRTLADLRAKTFSLITEHENPEIFHEEKRAVVVETLQGLFSTVKGIQKILKAGDRQSLMPSFMVRTINSKIDALNVAYNK